MKTPTPHAPRWLQQASITQKLFFLSVVAFTGLGFFALRVFMTLQTVAARGHTRDPEVEALLARHSAQLGVIVAVTAALVLLLGWAVSRSIVRPLEHTIGLLEQIADGDLTVRPVVEGVDEVARLSRALDRTVRALQQSFTRQEEALVRAEAGQRARTAFLATMSHEVRTPLNGVLGMAELLIRTPLDETQADYVRTLKSSGESLLRILDDMLDVSRLDAGRLELRDAPFELRELVDDAVQLFAAHAAEKGIDLCQRFPAAQPMTLLGDGVRLRQALLNLIGNALKFTERGHVLVEVRTRDEGRAVHVHIAVQDTGVGIAQDKLATLFAAFQQGDPSSTRRFGGTGVGLDLTRRLLELMGGSITVESVVGVGSTFRARVTFPRADVAVEKEPVALDGVPALVVSDLALQREIFDETLSAWGAAEVVTRSHDEALADAGALFPGAGPCLLLLDRDRDDPRFGEVLQRARAAVAHRQARVVVLREVASEVDAAQRGDVELARPVRMLVFKRAVYELCLGRGLSALRARTRTTELPPDARAPFRVLLAEDDRVNQRVALSLLQRMGCQVDVAANGREAIERGLAARYDIVFMDCQMPLCDGHEATRTLTSQWSDALRAPIVALTANALAGDRERCAESGMCDFIAKPLRADELRRVLRAWIPRAATGDVRRPAERPKAVDLAT